MYAAQDSTRKVDMEQNYIELMEERDECKRECEAWKRELDHLRNGYWHIKKPVFWSIGDISAWLFGQNIEKIYKIYLVVAIFCAIGATLSDIYRNVR